MHLDVVCGWRRRLPLRMGASKGLLVKRIAAAVEDDSRSGMLHMAVGDMGGMPDSYLSRDVRCAARSWVFDCQCNTRHWMSGGQSDAVVGLPSATRCTPSRRLRTNQSPFASLLRLTVQHP